VHRTSGQSWLNKAGRCWDGLEDVIGLRPNTSPKSLSKTLERVSVGCGARDLFFNCIRADEGEKAFGMPIIFSKAFRSVMLKKGYDRFKQHCLQFNLLIWCGPVSDRPQYTKVVSKHVRVWMLNRNCSCTSSVMIPTSSWESSKTGETGSQRPQAPFREIYSQVYRTGVLIQGC
ncbi:MAG: hypothetical protein WCQ63_06035, partial [Methanomethylophilus sp.]|nr:hypothetical protein [Methanomethylophilus sp.]MDD4222293.1 hypothetical protein [Methanomethylophilus sp.]